MVYTGILSTTQPREFNIKQTRVSKEGNRVNVKAAGPIDDITALKTKELILEVMATIPGRVDIIIDLSTGKFATKAAKSIWHSISGLSQIRKAVIIGNGPAYNILMHYFVSIPAGRKMGFFSTGERADAWLKK